MRQRRNTHTHVRTHTHTDTCPRSIECIYHIESNWGGGGGGVRWEKRRSAQRRRSCLQNHPVRDSFFGCSVIVLNSLTQTIQSGRGGGGGIRSLKRPETQRVGQPPPNLVPLQFVDNDSSKGQRACTSSHHAITVHRKHFLLLFFFSWLFYGHLCFFVEKEEVESSCLSLVDFFFTNLIKLQVELLFFFLSLSLLFFFLL